MATETVFQDQIEDQFVNVASQLNDHFPDLDLRFSLREGSNRLRYQIADISRKNYELELGRTNTRQIVHEAIFNIKQMAQLFDD